MSGCGCRCGYGCGCRCRGVGVGVDVDGDDSISLLLLRPPGCLGRGFSLPPRRSRSSGLPSSALGHLLGRAQLGLPLWPEHRLAQRCYPFSVGTLTFFPVVRRFFLFRLLTLSASLRPVLPSPSPSLVALLSQ